MEYGYNFRLRATGENNKAAEHHRYNCMLKHAPAHIMSVKKTQSTCSLIPTLRGGLPSPDTIKRTLNVLWAVVSQARADLVLDVNPRVGVRVLRGGVDGRG
jgi:hypothetical protein